MREETQTKRPELRADKSFIKVWVCVALEMIFWAHDSPPFTASPLLSREARRGAKGRRGVVKGISVNALLNLGLESAACPRPLNPHS